MLVLKTDKTLRRFCHHCKAPMSIVKETDEILVARCPQWRGAEGENHDFVMRFTDSQALVRYALELFGPTRK
jgi:hypothetical protein